jgi:hypothetical protein
MRLRKPGYQHGNWPGTGVRAEGHGPQLSFAAATIAGFALWAGCSATLPAGFAAPIVTSLFLLMAAIFGLVAWLCRAEDPGTITYKDVAGALTLVGLCASATIDPEQLVRLAQERSGDN